MSGTPVEISYMSLTPSNSAHSLQLPTDIVRVIAKHLLAIGQFGYMRVFQQNQQRHLVRNRSYSAQNVCALGSANIQEDTRILMAFRPYGRGRISCKATRSGSGGLGATEGF